MTRVAIIGIALSAMTGGACASDPHDVYVVEAPPETRPPLPVATVPTVEAGDDVSEPLAPATYEPNGETVDVRSLDNSFRPATLEIVAGTEVNWINGGRNEHNVLPVDEIAELVPDLRAERGDFVPGDEYAYVFDTPGVYPYYCSIHGTQAVGMVGTVVVTAP